MKKKVTKVKEIGLKFDQAKSKWFLMPFVQLGYIVDVITFGSVK